MKKRISLVSIGVSLILVGCGGGGSGSQDSTDKEVKSSISVPRTISMNMPKALQKEKKKKLSKFQKGESNETAPLLNTNKRISRGYLELKDDIVQFEESKKELEINLLLASKIMPQIEKACQDVPLKTTCTIEEGRLSLLLDAKIRQEIKSIDSEEMFIDEDIEIPLGEIAFTQYPASDDYQYALVMDMSSFENDEDEASMNSTQTLKWSKDENRIVSIDTLKGVNFSDKMLLRYLKKADGKTEVEVNDKFEDESMKGEFNFKISNLKDNYKITSSSIDYEGENQIGSNISIGEISETTGGYLSFKGVYDGSEYREKEKFNAKGEMVYNRYCDSSEECTLSDESTWLEYGEDDIDISFESDFVELTVTGGDLKEGDYLLLPPKSTIAGLTTDEIYEMTIGSIFVTEEEVYGMLDSKESLSLLDDLVFVYINIDFDGESLFPPEPTPTPVVTPEPISDLPLVPTPTLEVTPEPISDLPPEPTPTPEVTLELMPDVVPEPPMFEPTFELLPADKRPTLHAITH